MRSICFGQCPQRACLRRKECIGLPLGSASAPVGVIVRTLLSHACSWQLEQQILEARHPQGRGSRLSYRAQKVL